MSVSVQEAAEFLKRKSLEQVERRLLLHKKATQDFSSMVNFIRERYPHVGIFQWGSLLHSESFDELSDVDIALTNVKSPQEFFQIQGSLMKMTEFFLDCIELDKISPENRGILLQKGKWIHEP